MKKTRNSANVFAKDCIATALIKLMKQKKYDDITITDIAETAGVSRVTYYRNYGSKEEILTHHIDELGFKLDQEMKSLNPAGDMYASMLTFFGYWNKQSDFLLCLHEAKLFYILLEHINQSISMFATTPQKKYEACFYVGSMHNVMSEWVKGGMKESSEEMAAILCDLYQNPLLPKRKLQETGDGKGF